MVKAAGIGAIKSKSKGNRANLFWAIATRPKIKRANSIYVRSPTPIVWYLPGLGTALFRKNSELKYFRYSLINRRV